MLLADHKVGIGILTMRPLLTCLNFSSQLLRWRQDGRVVVFLAKTRLLPLAHNVRWWFAASGFFFSRRSFHQKREQIFANEEVKKTSVSSVVGWWYCENTNFDVFIICRRIWVPFFVVVVESFKLITWRSSLSRTLHN